MTFSGSIQLRFGHEVINLLGLPAFGTALHS